MTYLDRLISAFLKDEYGLEEAEIKVQAYRVRGPTNSVKLFELHSTTDKELPD